MCTVRPVAFLVQDNAYKFTTFSKFAILDCTSSSCVGGKRIPSALALNYSDLFYSKSAYASETAAGNNIIETVLDIKTNAYC